VIKLNLGCGNRKLHGFINIDMRPEVAPDVVGDITSINSTYDNEVELIYACHVLEHFPLEPFPFQPKTYFDVLRDWYAALKPGGVLRLAVPDLQAAFEHFLTTRDLASIRALLYGGQKYDYDFHYHGWTADTLSNDLMKMGFRHVRLYDWNETEHYYVDDYSQAYLPHMDKRNGKLMSLNMEAVK
jgi:predicted SAM-dependent methyltransferase